MFSESAKGLDRVFRALASAQRREILRLAAPDRCAVTQFAAQLKMSEPAVSKHVRVLVDAALLSKTREGRFCWCRLRRRALELARERIEKLSRAIARPSRRKTKSAIERTNRQQFCA